MDTQLDMNPRSTLGWAPSFGYLLTMLGGLAIATAGCRDRAESHVTAEDTRPNSIAQEQLPVNSDMRHGVLPQTTVSHVSTLLPAANTPASAPVAAAVSTMPSTTDGEVAALTVKRFVVATGIDNREPRSSGATFSLGETIYAFAELSSGNGAPSGIEIVFEHEGGRKVGFVKLDVPADKVRWRTWGQSRNITKTGRWTAVLFDGRNTELARVPFEVVMPEVSVAGASLAGG